MQACAQAAGCTRVRACVRICSWHAAVHAYARACARRTWQMQCNGQLRHRCRLRGLGLCFSNLRAGTYDQYLIITGIDYRQPYLSWGCLLVLKTDDPQGSRVRA